LLRSYRSPALPALRSFPTRRSSDLIRVSFGPSSSLSQSPRLTKAPSSAGEDFGGAAAGFVALGRLAVAPVAREARRGSTKVLARSEEHTSELQSLAYLVCRLLLEKK